MGRVALVVTLAALVVTVAGGPALAHFDTTDRYTHRACPATAGNRTDPINVVFTTLGTWSATATMRRRTAGRCSSGCTR